MEVLEYAAEVVEAMPEEKRGEFIGQVKFQVLAAVLPVGEITAGARSAVLLKVAAGLRDAQPIAKLGLDAAKEERLTALLESVLVKIETIGIDASTVAKASQEVLALYTRYKGEGRTAWLAWQRTMADLRNLGYEAKVGSRIAREGMAKAIEDALAEGHPPSYAEIKQVMGHLRAPNGEVVQLGWLKASELESMHPFTKTDVAKLMELRDGTRPSEEALKLLHDSEPGFPVSKYLHRVKKNRPEGVTGKTWHEIEREVKAQILKDNEAYEMTSDLYRQQIDRTIEQFNRIHNADDAHAASVLQKWGEATKRWLTENGL